MSSNLTAEQRQRIQENKQRALAIRAARQQQQQQPPPHQPHRPQHQPSGTDSRKRPAPSNGETPVQRQLRARVDARLRDNPFASGGFINDEGEEDDANHSSSTTSDASGTRAPASASTRCGGGGSIGGIRPRRPSYAQGSSSTPDVSDGSGGGGRASAGHGVCEECGLDDAQTDIVGKLQQAFNVTVCVQCKSNSDDYELLTKSDVQARFLLPEGTIKVLKFVERDNPRHTAFKPMKLYLLKEVNMPRSSGANHHYTSSPAFALCVKRPTQVRERSYARFGSEEGLEEERCKREDKKWENSLKRTKHVLSSKRK